MTLAKYLGCASNISTELSNAGAVCVQDTPASSLVLASYDLGISWDIVVDGDYVLNDISSSIRDGVYARVPTLWSSTECDYCYFLPSTLSPTAPPSAYVQTLSRYFNQTQIANILNETTLYPYETAPAEGGMSGAVLTLAHLLTDWIVVCPSTYLASLESNTTNPGNAYHALFATGLGSPLTPNPSMCRGRVCHADELYWVFGTAETDGLYQPLSTQQVEVTREVINRFTEVAWTGSPNYEGAEVVWEGYGGGNEMVVNVTESVRRGYRVAQCDFICKGTGVGIWRWDIPVGTYRVAPLVRRSVPNENGNRSNGFIASSKSKSDLLDHLLSCNSSRMARIVCHAHHTQHFSVTTTDSRCIEFVCAIHPTSVHLSNIICSYPQHSASHMGIVDISCSGT